MKITFSRDFLVSAMCLLANMLVLCSTPYITPYLIPKYQLFTGLGLLVLLYVSFKYIQHFSIRNIWDKIIVFSIFVSFCHGLLTYCFYFDENGLEGYRNAIGYTLKFLLLFPVGILLRFNYDCFLKIFFAINNIIIVLAIVLFFLSLSGVFLPYIEFSPDGREHYFFYIGATNVILEFGSSIFIRTAGFCDEPGQLGLVLTYLLVVNEFTYKSSFNRILYCIAGLLTFSAAFFITLVPIIIYWFYVFKVSLFRCLAVLFSIVFLSTFSFSFIDSELQDSIEMASDRLIFERFEQDRHGKFGGDNRSSSIKYQIEGFMHNPLVGVTGMSEDKLAKYELYNPTLFTNIARHGIFDILFYVPFLYLLVIFRKRKEVLLFLAIGINFFQRPGITQMFFLVALTLIFYHNYYNCPTNRKVSFPL